MTATLTVLPVRTNSISYDTQHSVTLSVQDWLCLQTNMGHAAHKLEQTGWVATAAILRDTLSRLREQTMPAIEAAAEGETEQ